MKNFHVPLPDAIYDRLRVAAERSNIPATTLAREAIDIWLKQEMRRQRHDAIAAFAEEMAGSDLDLDKRLESAGLEHLLKGNK